MKRTRKREFLDEMDRVVPWAALVDLITPYAPAGRTGRPPFAVEAMLRIHFLQQWFNLSDPAMEEALYDMPLFQQFAGLDPATSRLPDESTILRFRHLLEAHDLAPQILGAVNAKLAARGLSLKSGTVVDATLIAAPSSTKSSSGERDPEMHQTKKGNQWHFGMKVHIGVDSKTGLVHSSVVTGANVHDKHPLPDLLHGAEKRVYGDRGYQGCGEIIKAAAPQARDFTNRRVRQPWGEDEAERLRNRTKSRTRARVEHAFLVLKRLWGFAKVRYRGLAKNANRAFTALAMVNLFMAARRAPALVRP